MSVNNSSKNYYKEEHELLMVLHLMFANDVCSTTRKICSAVDALS